MPKAAIAAVPKEAMTLSSRKVDSGRATIDMLAGAPMRSMCQNSPAASATRASVGRRNGAPRATEARRTGRSRRASTAPQRSRHRRRPSRASRGDTPPTRQRARGEDEEGIDDAVDDHHGDVDQHRRARVARRLVAGAERHRDEERDLSDVHDAQVRDGDRFHGRPRRRRSARSPARRRSRPARPPRRAAPPRADAVHRGGECLRQVALADAPRDDRQGAGVDDVGEAEHDEQNVAAQRHRRHRDGAEVADPEEIDQREQRDGRGRDADRPRQLPDPSIRRVPHRPLQLALRYHGHGGAHAIHRARTLPHSTPARSRRRATIVAPLARGASAVARATFP